MKNLNLTELRTHNLLRAKQIVKEKKLQNLNTLKTSPKN